MKSKNSVVENTVSCESSSSDNEGDAKFEIEVDDYKADKKPTKPIKNKKKLLSKTLQRKHLWKVMISKNYKEKQKNLVPNHLIILIEKIINML